MDLQTEPAITQSKLRQMFSRMVRVSRLDGSAFLELRNDEKATGQAVAVVALATLSYGIGFNLFIGFQTNNFRATDLVVEILTTMIIGMFSTLVWSFTTFLVGTKLFKGVTTFWGLVRPLFFSTAPGVLFLLISVPQTLVYQIATVVAAGWIIVAGVFAVKNAMGFSSARSMLTYLVGFWGLFAVLSFFSPR